MNFHGEKEKFIKEVVSSLQPVDKKLKWDRRYLQIVKEISTWSSCLSRQVGCLITVNNRIVATGYNGAPSGIESCVEKGYCLRKESKSGENLEVCLAVHSEQNALTQAARQGHAIDGGTIYCTTFPCATCMKLIISAGIKRVVYVEEYNAPLSKKLAEEAGLEVIYAGQ